VGGIPAVIGEDAGRLVPPEDPGRLAAALVELARDAALRGKLGDAARVRAEMFSTDVAAARLLAVYGQLLAARGIR